MGKPAELGPRWLVAMLCEWGQNDNFDRSKHVPGFASQVAWMSIGSGWSKSQQFMDQAVSSRSRRTFPALERALAELLEKHQGQYVAVCCRYKPWGIESAVAEGWAFGDSTYFKRLHAGHAKLAESMGWVKKVDKRQQKVTNELANAQQVE